MLLKDSGKRREFETGAVRDCSENRGRCDLLPLDVIGLVCGDSILCHINDYVRTGDIDKLVNAILIFNVEVYENNSTAFLEVSKHYEDGANKYSARNWEKGIPLHCYIDSAVRHYLKYRRGDKDEPHDRAFLWNLLGAIWTHANLPKMIDLPFVEEFLVHD